MNESTRAELSDQWHRLNIANGWPAVISRGIELTETIDGYLSHEDGTIEEVAEVLGVPAEHVDQFISSR